MIEISVNNLTKSFETGEDVLRGLSFSVNEGEKVAILGANGCGKTTLLRILTGSLDYESGSCTVAPGKRIGLISQIPVFPEDWTVEQVLRSGFTDLEGISAKMRAIEVNFRDEDLKTYGALQERFEQLGGYEMDTTVNKVANGLGIGSMRSMLFSRLSGGEQTRVNLARLLIENTDILLLDEPTNHLDLNAVLYLEELISSFKGTVLIVSHDRFFLDRVAERCIEIHDGTAEFYNGNYSFYREERQRRFNEKLKQYEKDAAKIAQLQKAAEQMHLWAFMGNDKLHKRAFSMEKRIEKLRQSEKPAEARKLSVKFKEASFSGDEVLDVLSLSKAYGSKVLFSDLSFEVLGSESVGIIGDNGTGKSTLLRILMGIEPPDSGLVRISPQVRIGYLPQVVRFSDETRSVYDTMLYEANALPQQAYDRLAAFGFRGDDIHTRVGALSGGERSRLKLCILMGSNINLLILDEPTNHLDIASREWIESALEDYDQTLMFVSHDRYFIARFATRILSFEGNGVVEDYKGNYAEYLQYRQRKNVYHEQYRQKKAKETKAERPASKTVSVSKIEKEIARIEKTLLQLDAEAEEYATDYVRLMEIEQQKNELNAELDSLYVQWDETCG